MAATPSDPGQHAEPRPESDDSPDEELPAATRATGEVGIMPPGPEHDLADEGPVGEVGVVAPGGDVDPGNTASRPVAEAGTLPGVVLDE